MKTRSLQFAFLALLAPAALAAQAGTGPGMGRMAGMSPYVTAAPPTADVLTKALGLNADQSAKYTKLRASHLQATKAMRDSLASTRAKAREAMQAGNRDQAREMMQGSRAQMASLQQAAQTFDEGVSALLTPEQKTKYDAWEKGETERQRQERRGRAGGGQPSPGSR